MKEVYVHSVNDLPKAIRTKGKRLEFKKTKKGRFYKKASFVSVSCDYYYNAINLDQNTNYLIFGDIVTNHTMVIGYNSTICGMVERESYCLPISYMGDL